MSAKEAVDAKYERNYAEGEDRKGECCKTCKSWKKGTAMVPVVNGEPKRVELMQCQSPQRYPKNSKAFVHTPAKDWCGYWEKS